MSVSSGVENVSPNVSGRRNPCGRYRNLCFTSWFAEGSNPEELWEPYLERAYDTNKFVYIVGQLERSPDTGRLHIQGYAECTASYTLGQVKSYFSDATMHIEPRRGTQHQAIQYCRKDESRVAGPVELGEAKAQGMCTHDPCYYADHMVRRYPFGSFARKRGYPFWERVERDRYGVFRSVRKVPRRDNNDVWHLEGEAMQGLLALNTGSTDIEDLAGGGPLEDFIAELEADLMDNGVSRE